MPLTDTFVKNAKANTTPKKRSDGGGLYLLVTTHGSKLWRLSYRHENKQKTLALGAYPTLTLSEARARRESAKKQLADGIDPAQQVKLDRINKQESAAVTLVILPFLMGLDSRTHAANFCFSFWAGVMPPIPMLGRSLL